MEGAERERNLALLHEGTEAYNRGDLGFVVEHAAEDIEVFSHPDLVNPGTYKGREEFEGWMRSWQEAWSEITIEIRGVETIGDDYLVVDTWQTGVGAVSGVPVEMNLVQLIGIREGQISRFHLYPDREKAITDLERLRTETAAADN